MELYEYKVVPAPVRGEKARGVKTTAERFALALTGLMNQMGAEGWLYLRADTLPCEERSGLTGTKTTYQNVLVFRRALAPVASAIPPSVHVPQVAAAPVISTPAPVVAAPVAAPVVAAPAAPPAVGPASGAESAAVPSLGGASRRDHAAE